jgi:branched-subunit amino acid aminotransferase/4-amino-4-deoxychorismate lyase
MTGLFETLGFDGAQLRNAREHRARMEASAMALGLHFDAGAYRAALETLPLVRGEEAIIRLELQPNGRFRAATRPYDVLDLPVRLGLSTFRVQSDDAMLQHKRTDRALYDAVAEEAAAQGYADGVLTNEHGHVTETSRFTLFADPGDGRWRTPALECGLLPGILRAQLLAFGVAAEADLRPEDLRPARRLAVGNSARGLLPAVFEG